MRMFEIEERIRQICDVEDVEDLDINALNEMILAKDQKIINVAKMEKEVMADVEALKKQEESFRARRVAAENKAERLRNWLYFWSGGETYEAPDKSVLIKTVKNGGLLPIRYQEGLIPLDVPEQYQKVDIQIDGKAVREALDRGENLGFACFGERGSHLVIK